MRQTSGGNEYYLTDDLGSTVALTNDAGSVTTTYAYSPFGATTITGASTNPFQFTGRENDGNGLYYYRARYYSPSHSRFLSEDPLEFDAGDPNLYAYVFNNPTNFVDPTGEARKKCRIGGAKPGKKQGHHSDPKFMGGNPKQPLTQMSPDKHRQLHKDLNDYLRNKTNDAGDHMRPQRNNSGDNIQENFSRQDRLDALTEFYKRFESKYREAFNDFFKQHPGQK